MKKLFILTGVILLAMPFCARAVTLNTNSDASNLNANFNENLDLSRMQNITLESVLVGSTEYTAPIDGAISVRSEDTMTINGKAKPNAKVSIYFKDDKFFTILANNEGGWSIALQALDIPDGEQSVGATTGSSRATDDRIGLFDLWKIGESPPRSLSDFAKRKTWEESPVFFGGIALLVIVIISLIFYSVIRKSKHTNY